MEQTDVLFKNKLLETFKAFIEFCNEHGIKYYACGGTLIGAVRHQGLIPWDDDIDVWMMPDDFKKFCSCRGKIQGHYDIMDGRDDNYWLLSVAKFVDVDTTLWEEEEYPSTAEHPEHLIHPGPKGKMYRSKSEASIATVLHRHGIPFRYEWDKDINGVTYHIDFTIRHPKTGQIIYWEHCGGMDKDGYSANVGTKIKDYESAGIFPDRNLILSFESKQFPFEYGMAEEIVERWFL